MITILLRRLRQRYPTAEVSVITNDPQGIKALDAAVEPISVGKRKDWSLERYLPLPIPLTGRDRVSLYHLINAVRRSAPQRYWGLVAAQNPSAAQSGLNWEARIRRADAVFLTGGGYFTDVFAHHAVALLNTLEEGIQEGARTFIVGCGFEPVTDPLLQAVANTILPQVDFIACREKTTSPQILVQHGVDPARIRVIGDEALELAYEARTDDFGTGIGVNLRNAPYNPVDDAQIDLLRRVSAICRRTFRRATPAHPDLEL